MKTPVELIFTNPAHIEFLKQLLDNPQISVPVKHAGVAADIYDMVKRASESIHSEGS